MISVKATREGLLDGKTSTGWRINNHVPFVALPSVAALRQWILIKNPKNNKSIKALVMDVGPWNENDDAYVFGGSRPSAESGIDTRGRKTNSAGIDLGEKVWNYLEMTDNSVVEWEFI